MSDGSQVSPAGPIPFDAHLGSFVRFRINAPKLKALLKDLGLSESFFDDLCGEGRPFGDVRQGSDSLFDLPFSSRLTETLCALVDRLLLFEGEESGFPQSGASKEQLLSLQKCLQEHREEIDALSYAELEKGYAAGAGGAVYEKMTCTGRRSTLLSAVGDGQKAFSYAPAAQEKWFLSPEEFDRDPAFFADRSAFQPDALYDSACCKYYDELLAGGHPDFFSSHDTPANRFLRFLVETPPDRFADAGEELLDASSLALLPRWAEICGEEKTEVLQPPQEKAASAAPGGASGDEELTEEFLSMTPYAEMLRVLESRFQGGEKKYYSAFSLSVAGLRGEDRKYAEPLKEFVRIYGPRAERYLISRKILWQR